MSSSPPLSVPRGLRCEAAGASRGERGSHVAPGPDDPSFTGASARDALNGASPVGPPKATVTGPGERRPLPLRERPRRPRVQVCGEDPPVGHLSPGQVAGPRAKGGFRCGHRRAWTSHCGTQAPRGGRRCGHPGRIRENALGRERVPLGVSPHATCRAVLSVPAETALLGERVGSCVSPGGATAGGPVSGTR